jgi:histidinol-phosphate/aromatic aminotransferase/cobyric acid decarboxylase-like protein
LSERAALAALVHDVAWVRATVATVAATREGFSERLRALGLAPLPSAANFVFVPVADAKSISDALYARGVAVRAFSGLPRIGDALRITIGRPETMDHVATVLAEVLA